MPDPNLSTRSAVRVTLANQNGDLATYALVNGRMRKVPDRDYTRIKGTLHEVALLGFDAVSACPGS